ncbi:sugar ABC transporter substrate-binding protein [Gemmobacter sp. LW-1]|uniref:sugar ABC transporter substrate-binding protein n=1 Tax=Gemmobacter sp. LW-1 TaxID=1529005 RepID=UPI0009E71FEA|nr:sugar ABC transporter substrate-binding protein [Gemmobacter sp. LW-1]
MNRTKAMTFCGTALALMLSMQAASAEELSLAGKVVGITTIRSDNQADRLFYQSAIAEAERLGAEVIALDAQSNDQTQVSQIQTLIAQQPDAVIEILGNIDVLNPWLERVKSAGIPLFTIDTTTPHATNVVASDNYAIGSALALQMVADMNGKGNILVFNGFYSVPPCKIRYDQMKYVVSNFPDVKIIEPELRDVIPNTAQRAYSDTTDMLTKMPNDGDIGSVWACWDVPLIGVTQAIDGASRKGIRTYGVDGTADFMSMIEDPESAAGAVVIQDLVGMGKASVQNVARHLAGEPVPPFTFVPHIMVTKANAAEVIPTLPETD